jgi:hypothetical protein
MREPLPAAGTKAKIRGMGKRSTLLFCARLYQQQSAADAAPWPGRWRFGLHSADSTRKMHLTRRCVFAGLD